MLLQPERSLSSPSISQPTSGQITRDLYPIICGQIARYCKNYPYYTPQSHATTKFCPPLLSVIYRGIEVIYRGTRQQQKTLEQLLIDAANALAQDQISQESFRTFNEAYNTARLILQRCLDNASEDLCDRYIEKLIQMKQPSEPDFYALLQEVEASLIKKEITQETFRTFMNAYQATSKAKGLPKVITDD
jgi:hypothetical protein